jgi:thiamine transport system substrate-binding protein
MITVRARHRRAHLAWAIGLALATLTGCSVIVDETSTPEPSSAAPTEVVLVTHESFALPKSLRVAFEKESGFSLKIRAAGDAGTLTNQLVLTHGNPRGDVAFGVDNTFASRALDAGVFEAADVSLPAGAQDFALAEGGDRLVPIDTGSVCVNVDTTWFKTRGVRAPRTLDDLTDPAYADLFVLPGAATSSPGLAFLLATIAEYGDAWPEYWADLMANGAKLTSGWSDAYFVDFTQGGGDGTRPIVLSYDSSPAFTIGDSGRSTTRALLDTCFRQVEYAGVLAGAANPEGARALIEFLLSPQVQAALPDNMYVFPVRDGVALPDEWAANAVQPTTTYQVDPAEIAAQREEWLTTWTEVTTR